MHSVLAAVGVKRYVEKLAGKGFRWYRLFYSMFAVATLIVLLWFQFSIDADWMFTSRFIRYGVSMLLVISGLTVMGICIRKYFFSLSGIRVLYRPGAVKENLLQQEGLHRFVRHPLYFGTLLFVWGLFLLFPTVPDLISVVVISVYVYIGTVPEEKKLLMEYGEVYRLYCLRTPKLFPAFHKRGQKNKGSETKPL